jgi:hypothetical protein
MTKKKVKPKKKTSVKRKTKTNNIVREKTTGDANPVRPASEYYNLESGEIYPKIFFRQDTLWDKIKRFFGFIP